MSQRSRLPKARHRGGLNDFEYCASLNVTHPNIEPDLITQTLRMQPVNAHRVGDQRCTPKGTPRPGTYDSTYWYAEMEVRDGEDITTFLTKLLESLEPAAGFLQSIVKDGGRTECFIGVFAFALCDQLFPCDQLATLGRLGIDLRLDYYSREKENNLTSEST